MAEQRDDCELALPEEHVIARGNNIFFYAPVSNASVIKLHALLYQVAATLRDQRNPEIYLFVNSEGGDLYAGLAAMDHIMTFPVPVHTVVEGLVASAATLIAIAGVKRFIMPHAHMLVHQLSTGFCGKYQEMVDDFKANKRLMSLMTKIYVERTRLEKEEVKEMLGRESHFNAKKAIKHGFVDGFYGLKDE